MDMTMAESVTSFHSQVDIALEIKGYDPMKEPLEYHISHEWYVKSKAEEVSHLYIDAAIEILENRGLEIEEILNAPIIE